MATVYSADTYADNQITAPWGVGQSWIRKFSFNIANTTGGTGFVVNDTVNLCPIPYKDAGAGVLVVDFHVELPALDTGGTSIRVSLGDTNGSANAFQATWYSAIQMGSNSLPGLMSGSIAYDQSISNLKTRAITSTAFTANLPKLYAVSTLYSGYTAWPTINFTLKITTAANTATTTGVIRGWLMLQTYEGATSGSF